MENGKDNIIRRIAEDTEAKVKSIIADGESQAQSIIAEAQSAVESDRAKAQNKLNADSDELVRRALVSAEMNGRKYTLLQKQQLVSDVFAEVRKQILALPRTQYASLMEKYVKQSCEKGETLVFSAKDKDVFTKSLADKYGLKLSDKFGTFEGGFVLVGNGYEKNVTVDAIVSEARLENEAKVVKIVFGE